MYFHTRHTFLACLQSVPIKLDWFAIPLLGYLRLKEEGREGGLAVTLCCQLGTGHPHRHFTSAVEFEGLPTPFLWASGSESVE